MDTNTAIYNLKKISKRVETGNFDKTKTSETLLDIRRMLNSLGLVEEGCVIRCVSHELACAKYCVKSIVSKINHLISTLKKIKEKKLVMECREASARRDFFSKGNKMRNTYQVKSLSLYDVILVPTQGGYHYSVVGKILQNDSVLCYPMTTGSLEDLERIGCQAIQLQSPSNGRFKDSYITSACASIPYYAALNCFVGKFDNTTDVKNAITNFQQQMY